MNRKVSTSFFNFRLFLEALKRLRVVGLASAILAVTASALVPAVTWIEQGSYLHSEIYEMDTELLCVPAGVMVLLAPLFFFVLFSFLQKRKESDFFHAIPYTRTCVYVSFVTAALAFVWAIQLACGVVAGVLWGMIPRVTADLGGMIAYVAISMLAAAMLSAFMMLALTVSGTGGSCTLLFLLFACSVRVVCAVFLGCIDIMYLVDTNDMWDTSFLSPLWLLPVNTLYYPMCLGANADLLYSLPNVLYSLAVTVAVFGFSGFLYNRRKSEMAGNPAPGVKTQALFRIMFTSLAALLIPLLVITDGGDAALLLVLIVAVLLVYFLYELITTKRPKNLLKALPGLSIVAGVCVAFFMAFAVYYSVTVNETVTANEVKWISVESNGFAGGTYQDRLSDTLRTDDPELIRTVTDRLAVSQKYEREGGQYGNEEYHDRMRVTIRLKGGRTLHRYVSMGQTARKTVQDRFAALDEVRDIMLRLPADGEVQSGGIQLNYREYLHLGGSNQTEQLKALLNTFRTEYEALSDEQKAQVMAPALAGNRGGYYDRYEDYDYADVDKALYEGMTLSLSGRVNGQRFNNEYIILDEMPKTRKAMAYLFGVDQMNASYFDVAGEAWGGSLADVLEAFNDCAADPDFTETFSYLKGTVELTGFSEGASGSNLYATFLLEAEDYERFSKLLLKTCAVTESTKESDFTLTDETYCLYLYHDSDGKYSQINLRLRGVFRFTPEDLEELTEILQIEK